MDHFDDRAATPPGDRRDRDAGQLDANEINAAGARAEARRLTRADPADAQTSRTAADERRYAFRHEIGMLAKAIARPLDLDDVISGRASSLLRDSKSLLGIKVGEKIPCTAV